MNIPSEKQKKKEKKGFCFNNNNCIKEVTYVKKKQKIPQFSFFLVVRNCFNNAHLSGKRRTRKQKKTENNKKNNTPFES